MYKYIHAHLYSTSPHTFFVLMYPHILSLKGLYSNNKLLVLNVTCAGGTEEAAATVFSALLVNVGFNNTVISNFRACVIVALFFLTLYRLHRSYAQMGKYIKHMSDVTKVWLDISMSFRLMLPEQIYSFMYDTPFH